jgi:hypothetical protein
MMVITTDPKNYYSQKNKSDYYIITHSQIIINWVFNPTYKNESLLDTIKEQYAFGWHPMKGCIIEDGIMKYPGDPDFYPLLYIQKGPVENNDHLFFYKSDFIAISKGNTYEVARVD